MAGNLKINGVVVKAPQKFQVGIQTIDSDTSGRTAAGTMRRDIIDDKVKLECEWGPLSDSEVSIILNSMNGAFFSMEYPDPKVGGQATKTFYVGDRSAPSYSWNDKFKALKWQGLSANFIEQ